MVLITAKCQQNTAIKGMKKEANGILLIIYLAPGLYKIHDSKLYLTVTNGGWMDELGFYIPSTVFQSFRDEDTNEPPHDKTNKMICAPSKGADQP